MDACHSFNLNAILMAYDTHHQALYMSCIDINSAAFIRSAERDVPNRRDTMTQNAVKYPAGIFLYLK
jgi:hypothetical protein